MPFTVRVVLHEATEDLYAILHVKMKARGFTRFILGSSDQWYHLPPAEYRYEGSASIETVTNSAKAAAMETGAFKSVLVTENVGHTNVMFAGLEPASPIGLLLG